MKLEKYKKVIFTLLVFIVFSLIGWVWELSIDFFKRGLISNHGFLHGPWLPIYGTGGALVYLLLNRYRKNPVIVFMGSFVFCTIIEYVTGWYLETYQNNSWWNYKYLPFNIDGRICLLGSLIFGTAGLICIYIIVPKLKSIINKIDLKKVLLFCLIFLTIIIIDALYSFKNPNIVKKYKVIEIYEIKLFKK